MELANRREVGLPPFARMVRIIMRHQDKAELHKISQDLAEKLRPPARTGKLESDARTDAVRDRPDRGLRAEPDPAELRARRAAAGGAARNSGPPAGLAKAEAVAVDVDPVGML